MTSQANGTFEVKVAPLPEDVKVPGVAVGRMSIDKVLKGDLEGGKHSYRFDYSLPEATPAS